jgi:hypothetical protein
VTSPKTLVKDVNEKDYGEWRTRPGVSGLCVLSRVQVRLSGVSRAAWGMKLVKMP